MTTLREHLEAIQTEVVRYSRFPLDEPVFQHAKKALAILDAADVMGPGSLFTGKVEKVTHRLVPDAESTT